MLFKTLGAILFLLVNTSWAAKTNINQSVLNEYLKAQKIYADSSCTPGMEKTFKELDTKYRDDGNFIHVIIDQKVDEKKIK